MEIDEESGASKLICWRRRWLIGLVPVLFLLFVSAPLGHLQLREIGKGGFHEETSYNFRAWGWPLRYADRMETSELRSLESQSTIQWTWYWEGITFDATVTALLLASTLFVAMQFRRRKLPPWQFSTRSILVLAAVVAIVTTIYTNEIAIRRHPIGFYLYIDRCNFGNSPWFVIAPVLFGIGCSVYTIAWCIFQSARATLRFAKIRNGNTDRRSELK